MPKQQPEPDEPQERMCPMCNDEHIILVSRDGEPYNLQMCPDCARDHLNSYRFVNGMVVRP